MEYDIEVRHKIVSYLPNWIFLPIYFKSRQYKTFLYTVSNGLYNGLHFLWNSLFDVFVKSNNPDHNADMVFDRISKSLIDPYFIVAHVHDTHNPYYDGNDSYGVGDGTWLAEAWFNVDLEKMKQANIKSIEYIDREFGKVLPKLHNCEVTILSDAGMMFGEQGDYYGSKVNKFGHNMTLIAPELFRVPFIRGYIK